MTVPSPTPPAAGPAALGAVAPGGAWWRRRAPSVRPLACCLGDLRVIGDVEVTGPHRLGHRARMVGRRRHDTCVRRHRCVGWYRRPRSRTARIAAGTRLYGRLGSTDPAVPSRTHTSLPGHSR